MKRPRHPYFPAVLVAACLLLTPQAAEAEVDSHVVGRLLGPVQSRSPDFGNGTIKTARGRSLEFPGFRLINSRSGKKINIRPDSNGYFSKSLEPGSWTLERFRKDRPDNKRDEIITIVAFDALAGSIINMGTILIVVDDKKERLRIKKYSTEATLVFTYHYERPGSSDDFSWPLENLRRKTPQVLENYRDNVVELTDPVTTDPDSSRVKVRGRSSK